MVNLFEMLKNYKDKSDNVSYGSLMNGGRSIYETLNSAEAYIYNQIKESDRRRLINSSRKQ